MKCYITVAVYLVHILRKGLMMYIVAEDFLADFTGRVEAASFSSDNANSYTGNSNLESGIITWSMSVKS